MSNSEPQRELINGDTKRDHSAVWWEGEWVPLDHPAFRAMSKWMIQARERVHAASSSGPMCYGLAHDLHWWFRHDYGFSGMNQPYTECVGKDMYLSGKYHASGFWELVTPNLDPDVIEGTRWLFVGDYVMLKELSKSEGNLIEFFHAQQD